MDSPKDLYLRFAPGIQYRDMHFVGGTSSLSTLYGLCSIIVLSTYANIITMSIEAIHESGYKYDVIYPLS